MFLEGFAAKPPLHPARGDNPLWTPNAFARLRHSFWKRRAYGKGTEKGEGFHGGAGPVLFPGGADAGLGFRGAPLLPGAGLEEEIGDCLFSLLALCSATGLDAEKALAAALEKYASRAARTGQVGSGR